MPNKQSRKLSKPKSRKGNGDHLVAAPTSWATRATGTEVKAFYSQSSNYQLYHNIPALYANQPSLLNSIVNGNTYDTRIGTRIFVKELEMYLVLNNKPDRPNVSYRVAVCAAPATTSTDAAAELFANGGMTGLHIISNSELLSDTTFPQNQGSGMENNMTPNKEWSFTYRVKIPINRHVVYNTDNNCATRLIGYVTAYDAFGTLQTDNIASVAQTSWRIVFTDA
jgi:hypothetical protein